MDLLTKAVAIAQTQVGVMEDPPGSNAGYSVEVYLKTVGLGKGNSWCAAFVYYCFSRAAKDLGVTNPLVKTGGVIDHWDRADKAVKITAAQARKDPSLIKPGMIGILLIDKRTGAGHTFIIEKVAAKLQTIEGNSNDNGSSNGVGVFRLGKRKPTDSILVGFLDYSRHKT